MSGGVLYVSTYDGILRMLNSKTGELIAAKMIGGSLLIQPSIAEDSNLKMELFLTDMGSAQWVPVFPGFVQALSIDSNSSNSTATIRKCNQSLVLHDCRFYNCTSNIYYDSSIFEIQSSKIESNLMCRTLKFKLISRRVNCSSDSIV